MYTERVYYSLGERPKFFACSAAAVGLLRSRLLVGMLMRGGDMLCGAGSGGSRARPAATSPSPDAGDNGCCCCCCCCVLVDVALLFVVAEVAEVDDDVVTEALAKVDVVLGVDAFGELVDVGGEERRFKSKLPTVLVLLLFFCCCCCCC